MTPEDSTLCQWKQLVGLSCFGSGMCPKTRVACCPELKQRSSRQSTAPLSLILTCKGIPMVFSQKAQIALEGLEEQRFRGIVLRENAKYMFRFSPLGLSGNVWKTQPFGKGLFWHYSRSKTFKLVSQIWAHHILYCKETAVICSKALLCFFKCMAWSTCYGSLLIISGDIQREYEEVTFRNMQDNLNQMALWFLNM